MKLQKKAAVQLLLLAAAMLMVYAFFYPMPTHSRHNLIALESTVAASPRIAP